MVQTQGSRDFIKPETVLLRVRVNRTGSRKPVDPDTVVLTRFERDGVAVTPPATAFTKEAVGDYALSLDTAALDTGVYNIAATITGDAGVVVLPDTFVLRAL